MANKPTTTGFSERLAQACQRAGLRHPGAWLSLNLKVSAATASQWLSGIVVPTADKAWTMARLLCVPFGWLYFGEGSTESTDATVREGYGTYGASVEIPVYETYAGAGPGVTNHRGEQIGSILFRPRSLAKRKLAADDARVFYVMGSSMLPRLRDGDAVLFDTSDLAPVDGKVYVFRFNGLEYVKRLRFELGAWWFCSDNTADPEWAQPKQVRIGEDCQLLGRVRWVGSWED